jgi:diguanylate cyclase (GGDEF)-like protein/PAS domain S-box-containing protein
MVLSAELKSAILAVTNDGVLVAHYDGDQCPILFCNSPFTQLTDYTAEELLGQPLLFPPLTLDEPETWRDMGRALKEGVECSFRLRTSSKSGRHIWNQVRLTYVTTAGKITHVIAIHTDVSQQEYVKNVLDKVSLLYREMCKRLEFTSETDHLTQLKNPSHLSTRGEFILSAAKREQLRLHALRVELESFKLLNSFGGHALGEQYLVQVARVIRRYFSRVTDLAVRMADGEFIILCIEDDDSRLWERIEQLRREADAIAIAPAHQPGHSVRLNIGLYSAIPDKYTTIEAMIQGAASQHFPYPRAAGGGIIRQQLP